MEAFHSIPLISAKDSYIKCPRRSQRNCIQPGTLQPLDKDFHLGKGIFTFMVPSSIPSRQNGNQWSSYKSLLEMQKKLFKKGFLLARPALLSLVRQSQSNPSMVSGLRMALSAPMVVDVATGKKEWHHWQEGLDKTVKALIELT